MSATVDDNTLALAESQDSVDDSGVGDLEKYLNHCKRVSADNKHKTVILLCFAYVKDFTTEDQHPFNHKAFSKKKKDFKPTIASLRSEILRRDKSRCIK